MTSNTNEGLTILRQEHGYCGNCGLPKFVGYIGLRGWPHRFPMCGSCVEKIASRLAKAESELPPALVSESRGEEK